MNERTEAPTDRARRAARASGRVAMSPVLASGIVVCAVAALAAWRGPLVVEAIRARAVFGSLEQSPAAGLERAGAVMGVLLLPLVLLAAASALGALVQVGPLFAPGALRPGSRESLGAALRRVLAPGRLAVLALVLVASLVAGVGVIAPLLPSAAHLAGRDAATVAAFAAAATWRLVGWIAAALMAFGLIDLVWRRVRVALSLRRTREEARREQREEAGDPARAGSRRLAYENRSREAALDAVRHADLVVCGRGVAAALAFTPGADAAPRVLLAGRGWHAVTITRTAESAGVAMVDDTDLAPDLADRGAGAFIPEWAYARVAEWLRTLPLRPSL